MNTIDEDLYESEVRDVTFEEVTRNLSAQDWIDIEEKHLIEMNQVMAHETRNSISNE